jgi:hypothetical protein
MSLQSIGRIGSLAEKHGSHAWHAAFLSAPTMNENNPPMAIYSSSQIIQPEQSPH